MKYTIGQKVWLEFHNGKDKELVYIGPAKIANHWEGTNYPYEFKFPIPVKVYKENAPMRSWRGTEKEIKHILK